MNSEVSTDTNVAFSNDEAYKKLGTALADFMMESMQRPGFMRTLYFHTTNHTVPEFTREEEVRLRRIRHRLVRDAYRRGIIRSLSDRQIVHMLRRG